MLDKLLLGLEVTLIGLVMVFVVLGLLIFAITLLNKCIGLFGKKGVTKKEETETEEVTDNRKIAAVVAAVYAMLDEEKSVGHPEFVIKKIKEIKR